MRTASHRVRGLVGFLALAVAACWVLLRRRPAAARPLATALPGPPTWVPEPAVDRGPDRLPTDTLATDAGLTDAGLAETAPAAAPADLLAGDAGLTEAAPAASPTESDESGVGATADLLAGDAGLTEAAPAVSPTESDDLRAIRGVGPSMERTLHGLGITTYRQVADLDGAELERVRSSLQDFRARIEREDWIGQARDLHRVKYGDTP
ncbi:MAG TPA: hypothetical protein VEL73_02010 [Mycobacteriales bacterium]|nr:hypothetical protein [Mycobacteriales bacterium]